ncbi:8723_t:CDS:2 [Ambispora leptoticha]|uniref:8723_t:CDS:1 n=1 Tax=Ambispora leptoticha TaxID=144679 RepID=A0A9N8V6B2_9GLOM|nr:8723_t:CDS:2 [Ambispora leptoticha]
MALTRKNSNIYNFPWSSSSKGKEAQKTSHSSAPQDNLDGSTSSKIIDQKNDLTSAGDYDHSLGNNRNLDEDLERGSETVGTVKETPLPIFPLLVLSMVTFCEPMCSTVILPFVYFMVIVRDFHLTDNEKEIGYYAGLISGLWLPEVFKGNIGVAKSMLGPIIGGYLSHPADNFPNIFGNEFWRYYPYLLPCLISSSVSATGLVIGYFMLPESHKIDQGSEYKPESEPLLNTKQSNHSDDIESSSSLYGTIDRNEIDCNNLSNRPMGGKCNGILIDDDSTLNKESEDNSVVKATYNQRFRSLLRDISPSIPPLVSYGILALTIIFDEVYSIYAVTRLSDGGLGYRSQDLALSLTIMGFVALASRSFMFTVLRKPARAYQIVWFLYIPVYVMFPLINTLKQSFNCYFDSELASVVCPDQGNLTNERIIWYILLITLGVRYFLNVFGYTSILIVITNSAPRNVLGTVNGIGQTIASFARAVGPALGGALWTWSLKNNLGFPFDRHFVFIVMSVAAFIGWLQSYRISRKFFEF